MEHRTLFLCDIHGTYRKNLETEIIPQYEMLEFLKELEELRLMNQSKKLLFSFVSTELESTVNYECDLFALYNNNQNIELGTQFFESGYIERGNVVYTNIQGKVFQIMSYLEQMQKQYYIDAVYYADDTDFYHLMLNELLSNSNLQDKIYPIIPKTGAGLVELNRITRKLLNHKVYSL